MKIFTAYLAICTVAQGQEVVRLPSVNHVRVHHDDAEMMAIGDEPQYKDFRKDYTNKTVSEVSGPIGDGSNETVSDLSVETLQNHSDESVVFHHPHYVGGRSNGSGIPMDLFLQWWSVVRPFGNEMVSTPIFPWMVSVQERQGMSESHLCSGNILTRLYVLSTCRCLSNPTGSTVMPLVARIPRTISILAGISMLDLPLKEQLFHGQIRNAFDITIHPQCANSQKYDFGVIELEYYLYFTNRVLPMPDLFDTFRISTSRRHLRSSFSMRQNDICQVAGWPQRQALWDGESERTQKESKFVILGQDKCFEGSSNFFTCAKFAGEYPWTLGYGRFGDYGSGLVCNDRVTAILSMVSGDHVVFSNLRPALSFLWKYYQDRNDMYFISSSVLPAISSMLFMITVQVPTVVTHLNQAN